MTAKCLICWRFSLCCCKCSSLYLCWTASRQRASLPCPALPPGLLCGGGSLWISVQRNASLVAVTGGIRREMRAHLPCVRAYLGLSWGTNSKACLCSSRSEGRGSHLSTLWITAKQREQTLTADFKLKGPFISKAPEPKKRSRKFSHTRSVCVNHRPSWLEVKSSSLYSFWL